MSFVFSGVKYPIHPLDSNLNGTDLQITGGTGGDICIGAVSLLPALLQRQTSKRHISLLVVPTYLIRRLFWKWCRASL